MLTENPIKNTREAFGPYLYFNEPGKVIRKGGLYYVEYPIKFQRVENLVYLTFVVENISPGSSIHGFAFSDTRNLNE